MEIVIIILLIAIIVILIIIHGCVYKDKKPHFEQTIIYNNLKIKGAIKMVSMPYSFKVLETLGAVDADGQPEPIQPGSCVITSADPSIVRIEVDPTNELIFTAFGSNDPTKTGSCLINFAAKSAAGVDFTGSTEIVITGEDAVAFTTTVGVPEHQ